MTAPPKTNALKSIFQVAGWLLKNWPTVLKVTYQTVIAVQNLAIYFRTGNPEKRVVASNVIVKLIRERFAPPAAIDARLDAIVNSTIEIAVTLAKQTMREAWRFDPLPLGQLIGQRSIDKAETLVRSGMLPTPTLKSEPEYLLLAIEEFRAIELKNAARAPDALDARLAAAGLRGASTLEE